MFRFTLMFISPVCVIDMKSKEFDIITGHTCMLTFKCNCIDGINLEFDLCVVIISVSELLFTLSHSLIDFFVYMECS